MKQLLPLTLILMIAGCSQGQATDTSLAGGAGPCDPKSAQFLITDGFQKLICGCQEPAGELIASARGSLTCTVAAGTTIFFHFIGNQLTHQIVPTDGTSFPASMPNGPSAEISVPTHGFILNTPGTYEYRDAYDLGIVGRIVVQ